MQMRLRTYPSISFIVVLCYFSSAALVYAQAGKAEVTGEVRDQTGAVVTRCGITKGGDSYHALDARREAFVSSHRKQSSACVLSSMRRNLGSPSTR
jgi:hypothetical protein